MKLASRVRLHAVGLALHLGLFVAMGVLVAWPALRKVDRALAPLQGIFLDIADRQTRLVNQLRDLELHVTTVPTPVHDHFIPPHPGAERSLLGRYAQVLAPHAVTALSDLEETFSRIEIGIAEARALIELGDTTAAQAKLREIAQDRGGLLEQTVLAQALVLEQGIMAREGLHTATRWLLWLALAWLVSGVALLAVVLYDVQRRVLQPVHELDVAVRRIAEGDWRRPVATGGPPDELGTLAGHFNEMADALRRRAGRHAQLVTAGELLAGVAHELNNPLQAIRGTAELNVAPDGHPEDWQDVLDQARRASKLVQDLLRFVRPRLGGPERVDPNAAVGDALDLVRFQFRVDGIAVELRRQAGLPPVYIDPDELVGALVNLLGNAHRVLQTHAGERRITIATTVHGDRVRVQIADSGPGIPPDLRERIFNPFFSTTQGGAGLGLAVARDALREVGGDLHLDATTSGASFTIELPVAHLGDPGETLFTHGPDPDSALEGLSILVVDDEEPIRRVLARYLGALGADVHIADGGSAMAALKTTTFDLVILDLRMPDVDGVDVYRYLRRAHPDLAGRTIFLSGDISHLGADLGVPSSRILLKPVELDRLRGAVSEILDLAGRTV